MPSSRASVGAGRRRSSDEIHRLLLEAASELFAEKGYAATTTREIGVRAGVPEVMLFRPFGSKASLFSEASLQPFHDFLPPFAADWGVPVDAAGLAGAHLQGFGG